MAKKDTIKQFQKDGLIMKKWTIGKQYISGFADFVNGSGETLDIFVLTDIILPESDVKNIGIYGTKIMLKNTKTLIEIEEKQEDRYGKYVLLDKKRRENIQTHYLKSKRISEGLEKILTEI